MTTPDNTAKKLTLRSLPPVNALLAHPKMMALNRTYSAAERAAAARSAVASARRSILAGNPGEVYLDTLVSEAVASLCVGSTQSLRSAVNATGIVLHTGLGRSRLSVQATNAILSAASGHSLLELDPESGARGNRQKHVNSLLCELTGARAAGVVNNCAGAVSLAIAVLAEGREVIISRGELVEIGGAFRLPDIINAAGAKLVEVGTTNRTRLTDYEAAITPDTALILRCHPSNYSVIGFTEAASDQDLVILGRTHGIPVMEDQGSGSLLDPSVLCIQASHGSLPASVKRGFSVIVASGDKLMGATQAGIILGEPEIVDRILKFPLARAMRVDKLTLAGLEATLHQYRNPEQAVRDIPTLRYLARDPADIRRMARNIQRKLKAILPANEVAVSTIDDVSHTGGGSIPGDNLPTTCVRIQSIGASWSAQRISKEFRNTSPAVVGRIKDDAFLLDPRTVDQHEVALIVKAAVEMFFSQK